MVGQMVIVLIRYSDRGDNPSSFGEIEAKIDSFYAPPGSTPFSPQNELIQLLWNPTYLLSDNLSATFQHNKAPAAQLHFSFPMERKMEFLGNR